MQVPGQLAKACDELTINGTVCQGLNYKVINGQTTDDRPPTAVFKGQQPGSFLNMQSRGCNNPGYNFWGLNAGKCSQVT